MKIVKSLCIVTALVLLCSTLFVTTYATGIIATPTKSSIQVNDNVVYLQGYTINGNNYFKLRDLASVIKDYGKNFSVDWDSTTNAIRLVSGRSYEPVGGELVLSDSTASVKAVPTTSKIYINDRLVNMTAYTINGYNYFKLRDLGAAIDFGVTYNSAANTVKVDTSQEYYVTAILDALEGSYYNTTTKTINYNGTDSGNMIIDKYNDTYFAITAYNISSENDYTKIKTIIGLFVNSPEKAIDALKELKFGGKKELQSDGKTLVCARDGLTQSVEIKW